MIIALFDGHCVLCQTTRRIIQALDWFGHVEFIDLHDQSTIEARYPDLDHAILMGEINVIDGDRRYTGFDGIRRMLRATPPGFPLWLLFSLPGMGWIGPVVYRFIARHRYAINRFFGIDLDAQEDCLDGICKIPQ